MQCPECGYELSNENLRYCEDCGAKLPARPAGPAKGRAAASPARAPAATRRSTPRMPAVEEDVGEEDYPPEEEVPARPPYHGPKWLEHVPGHSPSVLGVGLMTVAVVLGILPFFTSVGPFFSTLALVGGVLLVARELRAVGEKHALVDWVPEWLPSAHLAAGYTLLVVALAVRMLGVGITPILWAVGAALVAHEQWPKVLEGYTQFFQPRRLLQGTRVVALVSVTVCIVSLFLTWSLDGAGGMSVSVPVPQGPPQLQVLDTPRAVTVSMDDASVYGWDQPLSIFVELLLLGALAVLALKPDPERPSWVRFVPLGSAALSLVWGLVHVRMQPGPIVFLVSLLGLGFVGVVQAIPPKAPEPEYAEGEFGEGEFAEGDYGDQGYDENFGNDGGFDPNFNGPSHRRGGGGNDFG